MKLHAGTSGFAYKKWKGPFYPADLADAEMLRYYAERLGSVEINNTFYRMPKRAVVKSWAEQVPDGFVFVIKASRRITHQARLKDVDDPLGFLHQSLLELGPHLGPVLFQLPPFLRKDVPRLRDFLAAVPEPLRPVLEFRHASWDDDEVRKTLRDANAALCISDAEGEADPELLSTADFGYLRCRREGYDEPTLAALAERIAAQPWREAYCFFKHEDGGAAAKQAMQLTEAFGSGR